MDFRTITEEKKKIFQIQGGWMSTTPSEPIPTRLLPIQAERQGSQHGRMNWLESLGFPAGFSQEAPANGAPACIDTMASLDQRRRLSQESAMDLAGSSRDSGSLVDSHTQAMRNVTAGQRNIPFVDLLASTSGAPLASSNINGNLQGNHNAASNPFFPVRYSASNYNQRQPDTADDFPVHHHSYDLNSLPKTIIDGVSNGDLSTQFAPITPGKDQIIQNQLSERTDLPVDERSYKEQDKQEVFVTPSKDEVLKLNSVSCSQPMSCMNEDVVLQSELSHPLVGTSSAAVSPTLQENHNLGEEGNNGIDLNKTPQQKPKRKKHRPKVVLEGKPKRTPKQASDKQNPSEKRKYVRKKNLKTSETPSETVGKAIEPSPSSTVKSCRRVLNFNLEDQGRDEHHCKPLNNQEGFPLNSAECSSSRWIIYMNPESQAQDLSKGIYGGSGAKSTVLHGQGVEVIVKNSSAGNAYDVNSSAGNAYDVNSSAGNAYDVNSSAGNAYDVNSSAGNAYDTNSSAGNAYAANSSAGNAYAANSSAGNAYDANSSAGIAYDANSSAGNAYAANSSAGNAYAANSSAGNAYAANSSAGNAYAANGSAGNAYDANSSFNQMCKDYISMPETTAPAPQSSKRDPPIESSKCLPNNRNEMEEPPSSLSNGKNSHPLIHQHAQVEGISRMVLQTVAALDHNELLQCGSQSMSKCQNDLNSNLHVPFLENEQARGSKREYSHTVDTHALTMNMREVQQDSLHAYQEILQRSGYHRNRNNPVISSPEICKKRRTEKAQYTTTPSSSYFAEANKMGWGQAPQSYHRTADTEFNNMLGTEEPKNGISKSVQDVYAHSMMTENCPVQSSSTDPLSLSRPIFDELQTSGFMLNFDLTERMTSKRPSGSTRVWDIASLTANAQCTQFPSTPQKTVPTSHDRQGTETVERQQACLEGLVAENCAKKKRARKSTPPVNSVSSSVNQVHLQENKTAIYDQHQNPATSRGQSEITEPDMVPIDEIVQRLKHLNINGDISRIQEPEQNALVPYNGNSSMVPYEGLFDPTRKRQPRPKVDLDPETNRVWKLLMGKEDNERLEQMDKNKEKWWEEERRVFRGRAESFIARMHLVQGDRRFSQWKGSVVDSVVGVFLTQNVSDHLSSSAFMSLAARFPLQSKSNETACCKEGIQTSLDEPEVCNLEKEDTIKWHEKMPSQLVCNQSSMMFNEVRHREEREVANSNESFGSNMGDGSSTDNSGGKQSPICRSNLEISHDLLPNKTDNLTTNIGAVNFTEGEDRRTLEDALSSQNSTESSTFQITERNGSCSDSNSEVEDLVTQSPSKPSSDGFDGCTFTELLQMGGSTMFQEFYNCGSESSLFNLGTKCEQTQSTQSKGLDSDKHRSSTVRIGCLKDSSAHSSYPSNSYPPHIEVPIIQNSTYSLHVTRDSGILQVQYPEMSGEKSRSPLPSIASDITKTIHADSTTKQNTVVSETVGETTVQKVPPSAQAEPPAGLYGSLNKHQTKTLYGLQPETYCERNPKSFNHQHRDMKEAFQSENTTLGEPRNFVHTVAERKKSGMNQVSSSPAFSEFLDVERGCLADQENSIENKVVQSNLKEQVHVPDNSTTVTTKNLKAKKIEREKKKEIDWDSLRKKAFADFGKKERSSNRMDSLDWEAVRCADVNEIANAIKERGMNNMLAERINDFLNRLVREHGGIDLEWLRDVPPDQVKEYLLSIRGLGLKSVECVRLLTLHHLAFPVDTNVGRIAVRLGWVPLQPLPESLQLHLLEMYPMLESIQKYLWPRLCTLDQRTLYELHYQMITFGKVFCTKSKPNCNACPMRGECKHFASAFASARFALPAPEEKSIVSSTVPVAHEYYPTSGLNIPTLGINPMPLPLTDGKAGRVHNELTENRKENQNCEPIVEVPATPEPECAEISESDIEDFFDEDTDDIPTIKLNIEEFTTNLQNYMQEYSTELQEGNMSKALVALTPQTAFIPVPKLKNVSRLRTEHQVYELPDSHPLLKGMDRREPDDPCSYLLAIWTPGETAESIEPPRSGCSSQESGKLCNENTCFSCNSIREANSQTVRGTILIPCRTAMRGSFPLNGTYFQVNEVFADHDSSIKPIDVPRAWLWNLPRRTVYFGTSIPTIFKGLTTEGIQHCFWRGFVCVRGFDQKFRAPRPLMARLHFPASKLAKTKTMK